MVCEIGCLDCQVASGTVISRIAVKDAKPDDVELFEEKVLLPKALDGGIIKEELGSVIVSRKQMQSGRVMITEKGDVVIKLTTPYDTAYVSEKDAGIIISSHCAVIRGLNPDEVDSRYLSYVLSSPYGKDTLSSMTNGAATAMLKVRDIISIPIPMVSMEEQKYLGDLYELSCRKRAVLRGIQINERKVMDSLIMDAIEKEID